MVFLWIIVVSVSRKAVNTPERWFIDSEHSLHVKYNLFENSDNCKVLYYMRSTRMG